MPVLVLGLGLGTYLDDSRAGISPLGVNINLPQEPFEKDQRGPTRRMDGSEKSSDKMKV